MEIQKHSRYSLSQYLEPGSYKRTLYDQLTVAGVANVVTRTLLAPLERWRTVSQIQSAYPLRVNKYTSFLNFITRVHKEQGILAFWRGNLLHCWMYIYQTVFQLGLFDNMNAIKRIWLEQSEQMPWLQQAQSSFFFPVFAAVGTLVIVYPLDTYRVHTIMSYHKHKSDAPFTKFRHFISHLESFKNLYRGFMAAVLISLINFNLFAHVASAIGQVRVEGVSPQLINQELIASIVMGGLVHPIDTVRKMLQFNNSYRPQLFKGYLSVFARLWDKRNFLVLFNGMTPSLMRMTLFLPLYCQILTLWHPESSATADGMGQ